MGGGFGEKRAGRMEREDEKRQKCDAIPFCILISLVSFLAHLRMQWLFNEQHFFQRLEVWERGVLRRTFYVSCMHAQQI